MSTGNAARANWVLNLNDKTLHEFESLAELLQFAVGISRHLESWAADPFIV